MVGEATTQPAALPTLIDAAPAPSAAIETEAKDVIMTNGAESASVPVKEPEVATEPIAPAGPIDDGMIDVALCHLFYNT